MLTADQQAAPKKPPSDERRLIREMEAARALRDSLKAFEDDPELIRDTIEGETSLQEMIARLADSIQNDGELLAGIKARAADLDERKSRIEHAVERKRALIEQAMAIGELPSLTLPEVTLSLGKKPQAVLVEDEAAIPSAFWKPQAPKLDKAAIKDALKNGTAVPGASLDNGGVMLTIRRK